MSAATSFLKLNEGWNAEPNAPDPRVHIDGTDVVLEFDLNPYRFPEFAVEQRASLRFAAAWRYRLGSTNDEGWYRGQCRFSGLAPAWGEFYEVTGDLLLNAASLNWEHVAQNPDGAMRHFLFYLRDSTFECDARGYSLDLNAAQLLERTNGD